MRSASVSARKWECAGGGRAFCCFHGTYLRSPMESGVMAVYLVRSPGQMFAKVVSFAPQMFAWVVAIL